MTYLFLFSFITSLHTLACSCDPETRDPRPFSSLPYAQEYAIHLVVVQIADMRSINSVLTVRD